MRAMLDAGHVETCLKLLLKAYGPDILGFLRARPGPETLAEDAFMLFTQDVWRGLPQWQPRGTLEIWSRVVFWRFAQTVASS